ncbi:MAG: hypothetical protein QOE03_3326 [Micromonosporaceae bacterium]|nr:hypothetical protein [Micromonosporaceae bacterium]
MVTDGVPRPVRVLAGAGLRLAVRRAPLHRRADLAREWAAELRAIEWDGPGTTLSRSWRALAFSLSLACARSLDDYRGDLPSPAAPLPGPLRVAGGWKPPTLALLAPLVCLMVLFLSSLVSWPLSAGLRGLGADGALIMRLHPETGVSLLLLAGLGYRLGRRWGPAHLPRAPVANALAMTALAATATVVLVASEWLNADLGGYPPLPDKLAPAVLGATSWIVVLVIAAVTVTVLAARGARLVSGILGGLGAFPAVGLGVIVAVASQFPAAQAPRHYALRWFAVSLIDVTPGIRLPDPVSTEGISGIYGVVPTHAALLVGVSAFILCYLAAATGRPRERVTARSQPVSPVDIAGAPAG